MNRKQKFILVGIAAAAVIVITWCWIKNRRVSPGAAPAGVASFQPLGGTPAPASPFDITGPATGPTTA